MYPITLKFTESGAPVANSAIVIAGLATVSPEEHALIIRDVPPDERDQFRVYCAVYCLSVTFQLVIGIGRP